MSTAPTGVKFRTSINGLPLVKLSRVKRFIPHAHQVGFALNTKRLLSGLSDTSELSRPHPALVNAICLWSVALSRTSGNGVQTDIQTQEHHFLDGVVANSYDLFDSTDPFKRVQAIQTEILLAQLVTWGIIEMDYNDSGCHFVLLDEEKAEALNQHQDSSSLRH